MDCRFLFLKKTYTRVDFSTSENKNSNFIALRQNMKYFIDIITYRTYAQSTNPLLSWRLGG
jgi:hypothetical protein